MLFVVGNLLLKLAVYLLHRHTVLFEAEAVLIITDEVGGVGFEVVEAIPRLVVVVGSV